jgi:hypothetical protein
MGMIVFGLVQIFVFSAGVWLLRGWFVPWLAKGGIWHMPRTEKQAYDTVLGVALISLVSGASFCVLGAALLLFG